MTPDGSIFELDRFLSLAAVAVAMLWTPGPNNIMLAASGATYGLRRTLPHAWGVALGFGAMFFVVALFLGELFKASQLFANALQYVGAAIMLWLAWRVGTAGRPEAKDPEASRPFTFLEAAAFQWVNPKAWTIVVAISATSIGSAAPVLEAGAVAGTFAVVGLTSSHGWAGLGASLQRWLSTDRRLAVFNGVMGLLIAAYVVAMLLE